MGAFDEVAYDPDFATLTVGGGVRVAAVNAVLSTVGRAISTGTNQDVGLVGLTLGGGAAYTSRLRGLTCDALLSAELVTFAGDVLRVDDASDAQTMRLLRGGGAGGFVVTRMTFSTYETAPVTAFSASWDADARSVRRLADLEACLVAAPRPIAMRVGANVTGPERRRTITLSGQVQGGGRGRPGGASRRRRPRSRVQGPHDPLLRGDARRHARHLGRRLQDQEPLRLRADGGGGPRAAPRPSRALDADRQPGRGRLRPVRLGRPGAGPAGRALLHAGAGGRVSGLLRHVLDRGRGAGRDRDAAPVRLRDGRDRRASLSDLAYVNFPDSDGGSYERRHLGPVAADVASLRARFDPDGLFRPASRCWHVRPDAAPLPPARAAKATS
jgi:hypothetical protein